jgi:hypothetical protein
MLLNPLPPITSKVMLSEILRSSTWGIVKSVGGGIIHPSFAKEDIKEMSIHLLQT